VIAARSFVVTVLVERLDDLGAQVFVNDAGADVGDFAALGELVDDEAVEPVGVGYRDVDQEVLGTGDHEYPDGLR
jgi:hypothetical protein